MAKVFVLLADGFETIEALAPVDVLRRCGADCVTVALGGSLEVRSSHGVTVRADRLLKDGGLDGDAVVLPGGYPGYVHLSESPEVASLLRDYADRGALVAAICASPSVLAASGLFVGRRITCHACVRELMGSYQLQNEGVVEDGNLMTAAGAGWSVDFGLAVARYLFGREVVGRIRCQMEI